MLKKKLQTASGSTDAYRRSFDQESTTFNKSKRSFSCAIGMPLESIHSQLHFAHTIHLLKIHVIVYQTTRRNVHIRRCERLNTHSFLR